MFVLAFGLLLAFGLQGQFAEIAPGEGGGDKFTCSLEVLSCGWFQGTRQICHQNGGGADCRCGQSTTCG